MNHPNVLDGTFKQCVEVTEVDETGNKMFMTKAIEPIEPIENNPPKPNHDDDDDDFARQDFVVKVYATLSVIIFN